MQSPKLPENEFERTRALDELGVVYSPAEARFDRIVRLAKKFFKVNTALVSLVYGDEQWFKARQGMNAPCTPRDISFCGHAILNQSAFVIENALEDERFSDNPLVLGPPHIRFYAGHPIHNRFGVTLGTLCLLHNEPRQFSHEDRKDLRDFAKLVESELSKRAASPVVDDFLAMLDQKQRVGLLEPLTGAWNVKGIEEVFTRELRACRSREFGLSAMKIRLIGYADLHERFGPERVSDILKFAAANIRDCVNESASLGYLGKGEFFLICPFHDHEKHFQTQSDMKYLFAQSLLETQGIQALVEIDISAALIESEPQIAKGAAHWISTL